MPGKGLYAAASAMFTDLRALDVISQNLAHVGTVGYKRGEPLRGSFAELLTREGRTGGLTGDGAAGVYERGAYRDLGQGEARRTDNPLDLALHGEGYLMVADAEGRTLLSRAGHLQVDSRNRLVTPEGWPVQGQGGAITLPSDAAGLTIDQGGRIHAEYPDAEVGVRSEFVEQLRIVTVAEPGALQPRNGQYYALGGQEPVDATDYRVQQGFLENANVQGVAELVKMIDLQRRYDAAQRALAVQFEAGKGYSEILSRS